MDPSSIVPWDKRKALLEQLDESFAAHDKREDAGELRVESGNCKAPDYLAKQSGPTSFIGKLVDYPHTLEVGMDDCVDCQLQNDIAAQTELERRYPAPPKPDQGKSLRTLDRKLDKIKATRSAASVEAFQDSEDYQTALRYRIWCDKMKHLKKKRKIEHCKNQIKRAKKQLELERSGQLDARVNRLLELFPESGYDSGVPGGPKKMAAFFQKPQDNIDYLEQGYRVFPLTKGDLANINACIDKHMAAGLVDRQLRVVNRGTHRLRGSTASHGGRTISWLRNADANLIIAKHDRSNILNPPRDLNTREWNSLYIELTGVLKAIAYRYFRDDVDIFMYAYSILKLLGHKFTRAGRQRLHVDDEHEVNKFGVSLLFSMGDPLRLRVVPGSHLLPYDRTVHNPDYKPRWILLRPQKPCFVVFSRSLVHGGEGYPEPNERLHAYAEVLPPGVYLPHTMLWAGRNAPFLLADSREEVQHLERLDLAFNLARRGAFGGTQINVITVSDDDDEEDQPH